MNERLTYDEWVARGYHIKAGSKMVGRNSAGVAVFSASQVEANTPKPYTSRRSRLPTFNRGYGVRSDGSIRGSDYYWVPNDGYRDPIG